MQAEARPIAARYLLHQEGVFGLIAVIGIGIQDKDPLQAFAAPGGLAEALGIGALLGLGCALVLWLLRRLPALKRLENWQEILVSEWSVSDVAAIAVLSGLAEEALLRAFLQPLVGLIPAAAVFALLHVLPDRRLWFWPAMAFAIGILFGVVFEAWGFPAVATAHGLLNGIGLLRLQQRLKTEDSRADFR